MFKDAIVILLFLLSLVLLILGAIIVGSVDKTDETSKNNVKRSGVGIIVIGVIFGLATIIPLFNLAKGLSYTPGAVFYY